MTYQIDRGEAVPDAVRRLMTEQFDRAAAQLEDRHASRQERIHAARKRLKEARAILRMMRAPLGKQFALENTAIRDAARQLSAARDADAMLEALQLLEDSPELTSTDKRRARRALEKRRGSIDAESLDATIAAVLDQLIAARARLEDWPAFEDRFETLAPGLRRTYADGRGEMKSALRELSPEAFHEWRKRVKDLWYHTQLLGDVWPNVMQGLASSLHDVAKALGDHHDLAVLAQLVRDSPADFVRRGTTPEPLLSAIAQQMSELERRAAALGMRIYAEKPGDWLRRIERYWDAWRS